MLSNILTMEQILYYIQYHLQGQSVQGIASIWNSLHKHQITAMLLFTVWKRLKHGDWIFYQGTASAHTLLGYCHYAFLLLNENDHLRRLMDETPREDQQILHTFIDWITATTDPAFNPTQTVTLDLSAALMSRGESSSKDALNVSDLSGRSDSDIQKTLSGSTGLTLSHVLPWW
jgi:hypothetical protein